MEKEEYITEYTLKNKTKKFVYLVCTKRGNKTNLCLGKAKYEKNTGKLIIYENCIDNNNHTKLNFERLKKLYRQENLNMIDINNIRYQKILCKMFNIR